MYYLCIHFLFLLAPLFYELLNARTPSCLHNSIQNTNDSNQLLNGGTYKYDFSFIGKTHKQVADSLSPVDDSIREINFSMSYLTYYRRMSKLQNILQFYCQRKYFFFSHMKKCVIYTKKLNIYKILKYLGVKCMNE